MVATRDDAETATVAFADAGEPADVLLLVDEDVVGLRRAQPVPVDLQRTMILVNADVEEERGVAAPDDTAARLRQDIGQVLSRVPAPDAQGEVFRAAQVGAPRLKPVVWRMPCAAELEIVR